MDSVAMSPDGRLIVAGSNGRTVAVWDLASQREFTGHQGRVNSVAVSPDGRHIVAGTGEGTVVVWDLATGQCLRRAHRASRSGEFRGGEPRRPTHRLRLRRQDRGGVGSRHRATPERTHRALR